MSKPVLSISFDVPFTEAIAWAKDRISVLPDTYYNDLPAQARSRAFTVSGLSALDQIQGVLDSLHKATENGETFAQWKKSLTPEVLALGNSRLDNIFRAAIQTHYNIGRYQQQEANKAHRPYRMYDAINDGRTRPHHKALDNFIAPISDPIRGKIYPPNGFRCRCSTISLTEAQAKQRGYKIGNLPPPDGRSDEGWDYDKLNGQDAALKRIITDRLAKCNAFDFAGKRTNKPVWCYEKGKEFAESLLNAADNGGMKNFDFIGQRPGLRDLPPIVVTELTGEEFGRGLTHKQLTEAANQKLRIVQQGNGLPNGDTGWVLRVNKKGRKKMGDNEAQSDIELRSVSGIDQLSLRAIVAERHADDEHHNEFVRAVFRLYAPVAIGDDLYRIKLTVKDYIGTAAKKELHALAAIEIENAPLGTLPTSLDSSLVQSGQPTTGRTITIADLLHGATLNDGSEYVF